MEHQNPHRFRDRYREYRTRLTLQRILGLILVVLSVVMLKAMAGTGEDCSAVLLTLPAGVYFIVTRKIWLQ